MRAAPSVRSARGVDEIVCFVSASETHNRANLNASIAESLANVDEVARHRAGQGHVRGAVACAFGCPFEGEVPVDAAHARRRSLRELGFDALTLGDTTGMATPPTGRTRSSRRVAERYPRLPIALHFHNTRGIGLANVMAGLDLGMREYESSIGGPGRLPVRARRDGQHLHRGPGVPARGVRVRYGHRPRRADRRSRVV